MNTDLNHWAEGKDKENPEIKPPVANKVMPTKADLPGACRIQSPSSILTYQQCPRKYYYRYIERLATGSSIHLIRGVVIHKVLEDIYDIDVSKLPQENFFYALKIILHEQFRKEWYSKSAELATLKLTPEQLEMYHEESKMMITNFYHYLREKMSPLMKEMTAVEAFKLVAPQREVLLESPKHLVKGYIDAIQTEFIDGKERTVIIDYKTSKKLAITPEYTLQLGIYAMMHEEHFHIPEEVGIFFLKHGQELRKPVTPELIDHAKETCMAVQMKTKSSQIEDYPMKPTPLCKWRTGQCDYYELCFEGRTPDEHRIIFKR